MPAITGITWKWQKVLKGKKFDKTKAK